MRTAPVLATLFLALSATPAAAIDGPADLAPAPATTPTPDATIAPPPLKESGLKIRTTVQRSGENSITLGWIAPKRHMTLQTSTVQPVREQGSWVFPGAPVQPVVVTGKPLQADRGAFAAGKPKYRFQVTVEGLAPDTGYYSVVRLPLSPAYKPVEQAFKTVTARKLADRVTREVVIKVHKVHVIKDGDKGLRGRGEGSFSARVVPHAKAQTESAWGGWQHYKKFTDGQTLDANFGDWVRTDSDTVVVQIQGREDDDDAFEFCPFGGGGHKPLQGSDKCRDTAFASAVVDVRFPGRQQVVARVKGDPALNFTADVEVQVKRLS